MLAYTYIENGKFALVEKPKHTLIEPTDAIVRVTMGSICSSDLHIKHGSVPRAIPGIIVGHEMVGVVEVVGAEVTHVKPGDRVTVNHFRYLFRPHPSVLTGEAVKYGFFYFHHFSNKDSATTTF